MNLLELKGFKSIRALNAFHTLLLGLKMLPIYLNETYEEFYTNFEKLTPETQETMIREAALLVTLEPEEVEALVCFCTDSNGIPYDKTNMGNLNPTEMIEMIVAVCVEISKIKINLVTEEEKKK